MNFNESFLEAKQDSKIKWMKENHGKYIKALENSPIAKVRSITETDIANLATQFQNFELYKKMVESSNSLSSLGQLPRISLDVITAVMAQSPMSLIANTQPIEEQKGIVYFRQIRSSDTRGSQNAGDVVVDPRTGTVTPSGYASNEIVGEVADVSIDTQVDYTFTLAGAPILSQYLVIALAGTSIFAEDVGVRGADKDVGTLLGSGVSGTVNYVSGEVTIKFAENPGAGVNIVASYQQDLEKGDDLQQIEHFLDSKSITAKVYALKQTQGMLESYTLSKRFGSGMADQLAQDLVQEINREVMGDAVRQLDASAVGTTTFSRAPGTGVSFAEHKLEYKDRLYEAENVMLSNAGRGAISTLLVGRKKAAFIRGLPGFESLNDGNTLGSHLFGRLDGINVVRVPETALLGEDRGIGIYKGPQSSFESCIVHSPFMPLAVTDMLPEGKNPLRGMRGAAQMCGLDVVVPQYATNINLTA